MINISICVSDIPKELIKKHENGKSYMNITVAPKKEVDKFGNTHTVYMSQTKEQREAKNEKYYIGSGKEIIFNNNHSTAPTASVPHPADDNLPF